MKPSMPNAAHPDEKECCGLNDDNEPGVGTDCRVERLPFVP